MSVLHRVKLIPYDTHRWPQQAKVYLNKKKIIPIFLQSRINAYKALTASSLIALSSRDPILTAFELSWELRRLSRMETEFRVEYNNMRKNVTEFATSLLDHARTSNELEIMLNYNGNGENWEPGERHTLDRLKLAIKYKQKKVWTCRKKYFFFYLWKMLVRSPSECSTAAGENLVWRITGLSTKRHGWAVVSGCKVGGDVSDLLHGLYDCAGVIDWKIHEKTLCKIYCSFGELHFLLKWVLIKFYNYFKNNKILLKKLFSALQVKGLNFCFSNGLEIRGFIRCSKNGKFTNAELCPVSPKLRACFTFSVSWMTAK